MSPEERHEIPQAIFESLRLVSDVQAPAYLTPGYGANVFIRGIWVNINIEDPSSPMMLEDKFLQGVANQYPAFRPTYNFLVFLLYRGGWMFSDLASGPMTPIVLAALLVSFFDVSA